MIDLMLDIESLGKGAGYVVLSAALQPFNINGKALDDDDSTPAFYKGMSVGLALADGLKVDTETVEWWSRQDKNVRREQFAFDLTINEFIDSLNAYMKRIVATYKTYRVWASAPKLDFGMLFYLYTITGRAHEYPFLYHTERCFRTMRWLAETVDPMVRKLISATNKNNHNPLDDCHVQIDCAHKYYRALLDKNVSLADQLDNPEAAGFVKISEEKKEVKISDLQLEGDVKDILKTINTDVVNIDVLNGNITM